MKGDDIAERLLALGSEVLLIVTGLPKSPAAKHVTRQLVRCGTAGGAHYEEARSAESRSDFAHKVLIAAKEVGESVYWLKLVERAGWSRRPGLATAIQEGRELVGILKASARTARKRTGTTRAS